MVGAWCWVVIIISAVSGATASDIFEARIGGFVGCLINPTVCLENEECVGDNLFGSCRKLASFKPVYQYNLNSDEQLQMEATLEYLGKAGYSWHDFYTQCIITSLLMNFKGETSVDFTVCDVGKKNYLNTEEAYSITNQNQLPDYSDDLRNSLNDAYENPEIGQFPAGDYPEVYEDVPVNDEKKINVEDLMKAGEESAAKRLYDIPEIYDEFNPRANQDYDYDKEELEGEVKKFEDLLKNLSDKDVETLKAMIISSIKDKPEQFYDGSKRSPLKQEVKYIPSKTDGQEVITRVVVNYKPEEEEEDVDDNSESSDESNKSDSESNNIEDENPGREENGPFGDFWTIKHPSLPGNAETNSGQTSSDNNEYSGSNHKIIPSSSVHQPDKERQSDNHRENVSPDLNELNEYFQKQGQKEVGLLAQSRTRQKYLISMYILCAIVGAIIIAAVVLFFTKRRSRLHDKLLTTSGIKGDNTNEYQDLCRQHMQTKMAEKAEPSGHVTKKADTHSIGSPAAVLASHASSDKMRTGSTGSSTSSWTEEQVSSNMDISTGHLILSYMENHLQNKDRLQKEWDLLCGYDAEPCSIVAAIEPTNMRKNRYTDILPYEHCRVKLNPVCNVTGSDYINASNITDHDPRNPAYIVTQGPLPQTVADFWQMVWEQGSSVIVNLTRLTENSVNLCNRYWPLDGGDLYHIYEVHLVSEHAWSDDYIVRSFYLKNLQTNETRTITQFHFMSWSSLSVPASPKSLLEFRRKVNKSFKGRQCPIIVHCSDGAGRTGTYCLIDMVLNRLSKGAKEIDIAATLEHIRDQRVNMVRTKEQFEFALSAVAQEVHAMLQTQNA